MSVRTKAKAAVKKAFKLTSSMWIELNVKTSNNVAYDASNPTANIPPDEAPILGVEAVYEIKNIDGDKVRQGDRRFYVDPDTFTQTLIMQQVVEVEGLDYRIITLKPFQQDVLIEIQLRSGG